MLREIAFGVVLFVSALCVVVGVAHFTAGGAWVAAGVLFAVVGWLVLGDVAEAATGHTGADGVDL